jgi:ribonuclease E
LIVIDFIDMDERRNNSAVEKRMKDRLKNDRARIQVGRISSFGLMEMSRQRLRPGMLEATTQPCPSCHGTGLVRSDDSLALAILRELDEESTRKRSREVLISAPVSIANYLLNEKREHIAMIEGRSGMAVRIISDPHLITPEYKIERFKTSTRRIAKLPQSSPVTIDSVERSAPEEEETVTTQIQPVTGENPDEQQPKKRRRRRRRRGGKDRTDKTNGATQEANTSENVAPDAPAEAVQTTADETGEQPAVVTEEKPRKSRTATRGRRKKVTEDVAESAPQEELAETVEVAETASAEVSAEAKAAPVVEASPEAAADEAQVEAVQEPKPKRAPRKPRAKKADTTDAEAEEKPKPRKRVRKKKTDEAGAETDAKTEEVKKPVKRRRTKKAVAEETVTEAAPAPEVEEPAAEPAPKAEPPVAAPVADPEPQEAAPAAPDEPEKPKRSGWWSRALGK